jgi:hypothetical protein
MGERTWWETTKVQGGELLDRVKQLVHEGNVRRIVISQGERTVAEFPLTAGLVGAVFAPTLAAVGALAALLTDCSIAVEREQTDAPRGQTDVPQPDAPREPTDAATADTEAPVSAADQPDVGPEAD